MKLKFSRIMILMVLVVGMTTLGAAQFSPSDAGTEEWSYDYGDSVNSVTVDGDGNVYAGGAAYEVVKLDSSGSEEWSYDYGDTVRGVAVEDGDVYAGGYADGEQVVKLDSSGNEEWSYDYGDNVWGVAVEDGEVYAGGSANEVVKLDSSGNEEWSYDYGDTVYSVAVEEGNVYAGDANEVVKLDSNGDEEWSYSYGDTVWGVAVEDGEVYAGGNADGEQVVKLDSNGNEEWSYDYGDTVYSVAVEDGDVYAGGGANGEQVVKLDSSGSEEWSYDYGDSVIGVSVDSDGNVYAGGNTDEVVKLTFNQPPEFDSSSVSPDPPVLGEASDVSYNVSDDTEVNNVTVEWFYDGVEQNSTTSSYSSASVTDTVNNFYTPQNEGNHTIYFTATDNDGASTTETIEREVTDPAKNWVDIARPSDGDIYEASSESENDEDITFADRLNFDVDQSQNLTVTSVITSPSNDTLRTNDNLDVEVVDGFPDYTGNFTTNAYSLLNGSDTGFDTDQPAGDFEYRTYWKEGLDQNVNESDFDYSTEANTFTVEELANQPTVDWNNPFDGETFVIDPETEDVTSNTDSPPDNEAIFNRPETGNQYVVDPGNEADLGVEYSAYFFSSTPSNIELNVNGTGTGEEGPDFFDLSSVQPGESETFTIEGNEHTFGVDSVSGSDAEITVDGDAQSVSTDDELSVGIFDSSYELSGDQFRGWRINVVDNDGGTEAVSFNDLHENIELSHSEPVGNYDLGLEGVGESTTYNTVNVDVVEQDYANPDFEYDTTFFEDEANTSIQFREGSDSYSSIYDETLTTNSTVTHTESGLGVGEYEYYATVDTEDHGIQSETRSFTVTDSEPSFSASFDLIQPNDNEEFDILSGEDSVSVTFEADVNTNKDDAEAAIIFDGSQVGTTEDLSSNSTTNIERTRDISTQGNYDWYVEAFNDTENIESDTRTVVINDEDQEFDGVYTFVNPDDEESFLTGTDFDFEFELETNDISADEIRLVVEDNAGSEVQSTSLGSQSSGTVDTYTTAATNSVIDNADSYNWYLEADYNNGSQTYRTNIERSFTISDVEEPTFNLVEPEDDAEINTGGDSEYTQDFNFSVDANVDGNVGLQVKEPGESNYTTVESFSYTSNGETSFTSNETFSGIDYSNEVSGVNVTDNYDWRIQFNSSESNDEFTSTSSSFKFATDEVTAATSIVDKIIGFFGEYWEAFMDGTSNTGKAFIGLILMLLVGGLGYALAGTTAASLGMVTMFFMNTVLGLFPAWIALAIVISILGYVFVFRGD